MNCLYYEHVRWDFWLFPVIVCKLHSSHEGEAKPMNNDDLQSFCETSHWICVRAHTLMNWIRPVPHVNLLDYLGRYRENKANPQQKHNVYISIIVSVHRKAYFHQYACPIYHKMFTLPLYLLSNARLSSWNAFHPNIVHRTHAFVAVQPIKFPPV